MFMLNMLFNDLFVITIIMVIIVITGVIIVSKINDDLLLPISAFTISTIIIYLIMG